VTGKQREDGGRSGRRLHRRRRGSESSRCRLRRRRRRGGVGIQRLLDAASDDVAMIGAELRRRRHRATDAGDRLAITTTTTAVVALTRFNFNAISFRVTASTTQSLRRVAASKSPSMTSIRQR